MRVITVRFPDDLAVDVKGESEAEGGSINQFVVEAVAEAVRRRRAGRALHSMARRRARMRAEGRVGEPSESSIRELLRVLGSNRPPYVRHVRDVERGGEAGA